MIEQFEVEVNNTFRDYEGALLSVGSRVEDVRWPAGTKSQELCSGAFNLACRSYGKCKYPWY